MARRLAVVVALATTSPAATTNVSRTDTSWWRRALAAPALVPDFDIIAKHVCGMPALVESPDTIHRAQPCQDLLGESWPYFPERCRGRGESSAKVQRDQGIDGVGHFGRTIVAALEKRPEFRALPRFFGHDSPAAAVAGVLEGDVRVELGDARSDGVSHLVDGRTVGLEHDVELTFLGAGNPLVAIHCMATADVLLGPEACGEPWAPRRRLGRKRWKGASAKLAQNRADFAGVSDERCSSVVAFARQLAAQGAAFRGLPAAPLNATSVDAARASVAAVDFGTSRLAVDHGGHRCPYAEDETTRAPAVCPTCRSDDHSYNSGSGRNEIYKCGACDNTRGDVDRFLSEWETTLKARLSRERKKKGKKKARIMTPEHLIRVPRPECAGYMKSWWGDMGVDEIFRCVECCRPWHAKDVVKMRAQAVAREAGPGRGGRATRRHRASRAASTSDLDDVLERED
ncbi:hypothetical protein JL722_4464 [Aureococcus anophagefferens]|nr:hypothetical protein JL722_4464 [Aureococcus anophagefferens]